MSYLQALQQRAGLVVVQGVLGPALGVGSGDSRVVVFGHRDIIV
jgi:hypothetical protein